MKEKKGREEGRKAGGRQRRGNTESSRAQDREPTQTKPRSQAGFQGLGEGWGALELRVPLKPETSRNHIAFDHQRIPGWLTGLRRTFKRSEIQ